MTRRARWGKRATFIVGSIIAFAYAFPAWGVGFTIADTDGAVAALAVLVYWIRRSRALTASRLARSLDAEWTLSGRLESGKNCCCTRPMPTKPNTNNNTVMPIAFQRYSTHQVTARRKLA